MTRHNPLSISEMKIIVFNKMKNKKMSYEDACKELNGEIDQMVENSKKKNTKKEKPSLDFDKIFSKIKDE